MNVFFLFFYPTCSTSSPEVFLPRKMTRRKAKCALSFSFSRPLPPSPGERREEKVGKKIFYTCTRYIVRCALYRQVRERSKRTRSIEEYARILYLRRARPRHTHFSFKVPFQFVISTRRGSGNDSVLHRENNTE